MKNLYLLCGIPGSGKSYWAKKFLNNAAPNTTSWISRDEIRYSIVGENEEYFSKENEVFNLFKKAIAASIKDPFIENIIVDATHLNQNSRSKTLNGLDLSNVLVNAVYFNIPLKICFERNAKRQGRERVPENVIAKMKYSLSNPINDTKYKFNSVIEIETKE